MKNPVLTVYDSKGGYYRSPQVYRYLGDAVRQFGDLANDVHHEFGMHPEDFTLFHIADYDERKGLFENLTAHVSLGCAMEMVKKC